MFDIIKNQNFKSFQILIFMLVLEEMHLQGICTSFAIQDYELFIKRN